MTEITKASSLKVGGTYNFKIINEIGEVVNSFNKKNMIVDGALNQYASLIGGFSTVIPKYISIGVGNGLLPVSNQDVTLQNEVYRSGFSGPPVFNSDSVVGKVSFTWSVSYESIALTPIIKEIGVFAQNSAHSESVILNTINTGLMMSRINVDIQLNPGETLLITRIDSFSTV